MNLAPAPLTEAFVTAANRSWSAAMRCDALGMTAALAGMSKREREDVALAADMLRSLALAPVVKPNAVDSFTISAVRPIDRSAHLVGHGDVTDAGLAEVA